MQDALTALKIVQNLNGKKNCLATKIPEAKFVGRGKVFN